MLRVYVLISGNMKKKTKKQKGGNRDQGKEVWCQEEAEISVVSLDTNRKVAQTEDKPRSSVAGISTTERESVYLISG